MINLERDLNERQRQAVTFGDAPLLVLAGPGTGKTRVITYRVAYLIDSGRVPPEQILTLTFTNKAAEELKERIHQLLGESVGGTVWMGTFHHICSRLLREEPEAYGLRPDFAIFDQETQQAILRDCLRREGLPVDDALVTRVRDFMSAEKSSLRDPTQTLPLLFDEGGNPLDEPAYREGIRASVRAYLERLRSHGALDFDDLLLAVTLGLRKSAVLQRKVQRRFRHLLVDEYQDINEVQYELLKALSVSPFPITAVGDEDQSIYAWRGSSPEWIRRFREEFRPHVIELEVNYRSSRTILHAAAELIGHNRRERQKPLVTDAEAGPPIYIYSFADEDEAATYLARVFRGLFEEAHIPYRDMALFYRNHRHADLFEQKLAQAGIPVQRVLPVSQMLDAHESAILAWLRFLAFGLDIHLHEALTFPTNVLDEWTRVWIQRRALRESCSFSELLRRLGPETPPLTRVTLGRALQRFDVLKERVAEKPISEGVRALFSELELYRSPYASGELENILPVEKFPSLADAADVFRAALDRSVVPRIITSDELDAFSAALLVRETLRLYFDLDVPFERVDAKTPVEISSWTLLFGGLVPLDSERRWIHFGASPEMWSRGLCPRSPEGFPSSATWTAFRFCQRLLEISEQIEEEGVVVYDLETTGNNVRRAEIIEFAATRLGRPEQHVHLYIRPKGPIPAHLTRIHGISNETVRDKPTIEEQIASIREFLDDAILVGHNIRDFDNRLLERELIAYLGVSLQNPTYDTYVVARRLFPHESHILGALTEKFGIEYKERHRADHDVDAAKRIFRVLRQRELDLRVRTSLPEMLPFLAVGCQASGVWDAEALVPYCFATARWMRVHEVLREITEMYPSPMRVRVRHLLDAARRVPFPESREDDEWKSLRERFLNRVRRFEETSPNSSLRDFLNHRSLAEPADDLDPNNDAVTLMTLHSAKGTEFRAVFVTTMEEGILPSFRSRSNEGLLAEERRLCYVGMTRAKERLYLVFVARRNGRDWEPSRFLDEIPSNLVRRWSPSGERKSFPLLR